MHCNVWLRGMPQGSILLTMPARLYWEAHHQQTQRGTRTTNSTTASPMGVTEEVATLPPTDGRRRGTRSWMHMHLPTLTSRVSSNPFSKVVTFLHNVFLHKRSVVYCYEEFFFEPKSQIKVLIWWHFWYISVKSNFCLFKHKPFNGICCCSILG